MPDAVSSEHWCPVALARTRISPWSIGPGTRELPPVWVPEQSVSMPSSRHFALAFGDTRLPSFPA